MARSTTKRTRVDPYKNFRFRLKWGGRYVAGVSKMSALKTATEVVQHREGSGIADVGSKSRKHSAEPITLERGMTQDPAFSTWASAVWNVEHPIDKAGSLKSICRNLVLEVFDEAGRLQASYRIRRGWVSTFAALPDLDADGNQMAIESMVIENDGVAHDFAEIDPVDEGS